MLHTLHEDFNLSCKTLAYLLGKEKDESIKTLLFKDFIYKGQKIRTIDFQNLLLSVLNIFLPEEKQKIMSTIANPTINQKKHVNVALITIIEPEFLALSHALNFDFEKQEDENLNGIKIWNASLEKRPSGEELSLIISMIGEPRNIPCAIACQRIFAEYEIDLCILIGIAGGLQEKVNLADVVVAKKILDYEHKRLEPDHVERIRPDQFPIDMNLNRDLSYFFRFTKNWESKFIASYLELDKSKVPFDRRRKLTPKLHQSIILAGDKLLANGELPAMRKGLHDKIRAIGMEGSGFARVCREYNIPWLVFRGISDFGDPAKGDEWQFLSALSASTATLVFLESCYSHDSGQIL
ncbi:MAG: hypothetical protein HQ557_04225 [Bacteroidetes bacterium]|nr:hypothetical protein [Bacteroidota bacterium]